MSGSSHVKRGVDNLRAICCACKVKHARRGGEAARVDGILGVGVNGAKDKAMSLTRGDDARSFAY